MPYPTQVRVDPASEVYGPPPDGRKANLPQPEGAKTPPAKPARKRVNALRQKKPPAIAVAAPKAPSALTCILVAGQPSSLA